MQMSITENKGEGHPEDNLGCPCLFVGIQYVVSDKDSRTTCLGTPVLLTESKCMAFII